MISTISKLLKKNYISQVTGEAMGTYIKKKHRNGSYSSMSFHDLGKILTKDFREVSGDVHMSASYSLAKASSKETLLSSFLDNYGSISNYGSTEVKILDENIGYYKISHFTKWKFYEEAKRVISSSIDFLKNTDALIIDLRDNPGGFEEIVAFLVSHFVDTEKVDLQEYYCRYQDSRSKIAIQEIPDERNLVNTPIYILINKGTGSAGESFAYIMKHLQRGTLIGKTTVGAGNGSSFFRVTEKFRVQISVCETINKITQTSWEKVGVIPDIDVLDDDIYSKALELAFSDGKENRLRKLEFAKSVINEMELVLAKTDDDFSPEKISKSIKDCVKAGVLSENNINSLGYDCFRENKYKIAEAIFRTNKELFPYSPNVYDSYAEALHANGKTKASLDNYKKAIELATEQKSPDLEVYIRNKEKLESKNY